jgi:hypothetical protein
MGVEVRHFPNSAVDIEFLGEELAMLLTEKGFTLTFKGSTFKKRKAPEYKVKLIKTGFLRRILGMVYTFNITLQRTGNVVELKVDDGGLRNYLGIWVIIIAIPPSWLLWIFPIYAWKHKEKIRKEILTQAKILSIYGKSPKIKIGKQEPEPQEISNIKIREKKFKVTLLGIANGSNREETEAKLATIFKKTPNQIKTLLDKRVVIGNNLDRNKAIKYKQALEKAGALYKIETIKQDLPSLPSEPKTCKNYGIVTCFFISWWNHLEKLGELPKAEDKKQWVLDNKISLVVAFFTFYFVISIIQAVVKAN